MQLKLDNLIKPYDGSSKWVDWIEKFEIVSKHFKWEDDTNRCEMLVLLLDGNAAKIVKQMPDDKRRSYEAICNRLASAFMPSPVEAHSKLVSRRYRKNETVEELYYDLVELWKAAVLPGCKGGIKDDTQLAVILPYFLAALPVQVSVQIRMNPTALSDADRLLECARTLMSVHVEMDHPIGAFRQTRGAGNSRNSPNRDKIICRRCGDTGHIAARCWSKEPVCYGCKQPGHQRGACPKKDNSGKGETGSTQQAGKAKNALLGRSVDWSDLPNYQ